jgi:mono/diheme cytochrome c family protein
MKIRHALLGIAAASGVAGAAVLYSGLYDTSATDQHLAPTYWLLDTGLRESVERRAKSIDVPPLDDEKMAARGLAHFRRHCVQCHGAPGVAPEPFALGMTPVPANLAHTAREWPPAQLFWVLKHGIKMAGMPAFEFRLPDDELWSIIAFLVELPRLSPREYRQRPTVDVPAGEPAFEAEPDAARGSRAVRQYACVTCHRIPGIVGPNAPVGPPLDGIGSRTILAGLLPNTFENMVRWLRDPQEVNPGSAMPDLGVSERDARDIAAYLATLEVR